MYCTWIFMKHSPSPWPMERLSYMKLILGPRKIVDHWSKVWVIFVCSCADFMYATAVTLHTFMLSYRKFPLKWWSDTQSKYHIVESEFQCSFSLSFFLFFFFFGGGGRWASSSVQVNSYMLSFSNISLFCHLVPFSVTLC